jgi:hypothetical protein
MERLVRISCALCLMLGIISIGLDSNAGASAGGDAMASYEGGTLDISQGWGTATVCVVARTGNECFTTYAEYVAWMSSKLGGDLQLEPDTSCSTGLDLYQNIDYGGDELILKTEDVWINLSTYSFSDETSSFKVGACSVDMNDSNNGGGNFYPGPTSSGSDVSWIGSVWNDRIASVLIS